MQIDIQLVPCPPKPDLLSDRTVIVIDVLRATSVIVHAMAQGAAEIIPVTTVEEAFRLAKRFPPGTTLLGGEKDTQKIEGFDLSNSPKEYVAEKVKGKRLILRTTNGTQAFRLVSSGGEVVIGSFFNITALVERCLALGRDIFIFPSGDEGHFSLEDTVCGGMIIDRLLKKGKWPVVLTDAAHVSHFLFKRFETNLLEAFHLSNHGKVMIRLGLGNDLLYCAQIDLLSLVPVFQDGAIRVR
jgi:2-phosphosulfolactate phosphatase